MPDDMDITPDSKPSHYPPINRAGHLVSLAAKPGETLTPELVERATGLPDAFERVRDHLAELHFTEEGQFTSLAANYARMGRAAARQQPPPERFTGRAWRADSGFTQDHGITAGDVIRFEQEALGNPLGVSAERIAELDTLPAKAVTWVTRTRDEARRYGTAERVELPPNSEILARDGDGGFLVLKGDYRQAEQRPQPQTAPEALTVEAIARDPWNAVRLPLPANPSPELLADAHMTAEYCFEAAIHRAENPNWPGHRAHEPRSWPMPDGTTPQLAADRALGRLGELEALNPELTRCGPHSVAAPESVAAPTLTRAERAAFAAKAAALDGIEDRITPDATRKLQAVYAELADKAGADRAELDARFALYQASPTQAPPKGTQPMILETLVAAAAMPEVTEETVQAVGEIAAETVGAVAETAGLVADAVAPQQQAAPQSMDELIAAKEAERPQQRQEQQQGQTLSL